MTRSERDGGNRTCMEVLPGAWCADHRADPGGGGGGLEDRPLRAMLPSRPRRAGPGGSGALQPTTRKRSMRTGDESGGRDGVSRLRIGRMRRSPDQGRRLLAGRHAVAGIPRVGRCRTRQAPRHRGRARVVGPQRVRARSCPSSWRRRVTWHSRSTCSARARRRLIRRTRRRSCRRRRRTRRRWRRASRPGSISSCRIRTSTRTRSVRSDSSAAA